MGIEPSYNRFTKEQVETTLFNNNGMRRDAAKELGISASTLRGLISHYGIGRERVIVKPYVEPSPAEITFSSDRSQEYLARKYGIKSKIYHGNNSNNQ